MSTFYDMEILAFILIILGLSKLLIAISLEKSSLYPLSHAYRLDCNEIYKQFCYLLVGDGLVSTIVGLFVVFFV